MSSTISVAALLFLFASAEANPKVVRPEVALPEAVLAHPAAETDPSLQALPGWWSSRATLEEWGGPWVPHPGPYPPLYDHRYTTW
jgi:hypothetical protein